MPLSCVLLDLDGVIRHFDPEHRTSVERTYGLSRGVLQEVAFAPEVIEPVVTGQMSRQEWTHLIGERVGQPEAAVEWLAARGTLDEAMLSEVDTLRSSGLIVAVLTNGTDTVAAEMEHFGLTTRFDAIFNSADIGYAKPDRRAFETVCAALQQEPKNVFFTDDTESKLAGAIELGMTARLFTGIDNFRANLADARQAMP